MSPERELFVDMETRQTEIVFQVPPKCLMKYLLSVSNYRRHPLGGPIFICTAILVGIIGTLNITYFEIETRCQSCEITCPRTHS